MDSVEKYKVMESFKHTVLMMLGFYLPKILNGLDIFNVTESNKKVVKEESVNYKLIRKPRQTELTFVTLKQYKGFENINEAEAGKHIEFIQRMAKAMYYLNIDEQKQNS